MKNSIIIKIIVGIGVWFALLIGIFVIKINERVIENPQIESSTKADDNVNYDYKIVTDTKYRTLQDDGGSHTNIYYEVNFENNKIIKYEDKYVGLEGYEYKDKIVYKKNIDENINSKLKNLMKDLTTKTDINTTDNYEFYTIEYEDDKIEIYNEESIESLNSILNEIDNQ
jgi:hypothetical protein